MFLMCSVKTLIPLNKKLELYARNYRQDWDKICLANLTFALTKPFIPSIS